MIDRAHPRRKRCPFCVGHLQVGDRTVAHEVAACAGFTAFIESLQQMTNAELRQLIAGWKGRVGEA